VGQSYFVFVTTVSGLYRYDMNDIIEVVGMYEQAPLIRFVQKGEVVISLTAEKLYEVQVIAAVAEALAPLRSRRTGSPPVSGASAPCRSDVSCQVPP
jgi:hypothetical protein